MLSLRHWETKSVQRLGPSLANQRHHRTTSIIAAPSAGNQHYWLLLAEGLCLLTCFVFHLQHIWRFCQYWGIYSSPASSRIVCTCPKTRHQRHGHRKGGGGWLWPPLDFEIWHISIKSLAKKDCAFSFEKVKQNFTTFLSHPEKCFWLFLENFTIAPPSGKKFFDAHDHGVFSSPGVSAQFQQLIGKEKRKRAKLSRMWRTTQLIVTDIESSCAGRTASISLIILAVGSVSKARDRTEKTSSTCVYPSALSEVPVKSNAQETVTLLLI